MQTFLLWAGTFPIESGTSEKRNTENKVAYRRTASAKVLIVLRLPFTRGALQAFVVHLKLAFVAIQGCVASRMVRICLTPLAPGTFRLPGTLDTVMLPSVNAPVVSIFATGNYMLRRVSHYILQLPCSCHQKGQHKRHHESAII
jgi:hypothetical protein